MRRVLIALLLAACVPLCTPLPVHAQPAPAEQAAIRDVITAQIEALRRDDGAAALALAAPAIRSRFGDVPHFLAMVHAGYAVIVRPRSFSFGSLAAGREGMLTQKVELIGADGQAALALYDMEHEPDGSWRIAGCSLIRSERLEI